MLEEDADVGECLAERGQATVTKAVEMQVEIRWGQCLATGMMQMVMQVAKTVLMICQMSREQMDGSVEDDAHVGGGEG
jgi:hypothetical protein